MAISDILSSDTVSVFRSKINEMLDVVNVSASYLSGAIGARPAANAVAPGTIFDATDTIGISISDGAAWKEFGNDSIPRTLLDARATLSGAVANGLYIVSPTVNADNDAPLEGSTYNAANLVAAVPMIWIDSDDYSIPGKTAKLRVRGIVGANDTDASATFTFGLHPLTTEGNTTFLYAQLAAAVAGSTALVNSPSSMSSDSEVSSEFDLPADGLYALGVTVASSMAASSAVFLGASLQVKHV